MYLSPAKDVHDRLNKVEIAGLLVSEARTEKELVE
jgi:hypothetical protein